MRKARRLDAAATQSDKAVGTTARTTPSSQQKGRPGCGAALFAWVPLGDRPWRDVDLASVHGHPDPTVFRCVAGRRSDACHPVRRETGAAPLPGPPRDRVISRRSAPGRDPEHGVAIVVAHGERRGGLVPVRRPVPDVAEAPGGGRSCRLCEPRGVDDGLGGARRGRLDNGRVAVPRGARRAGGRGHRVRRRLRQPSNGGCPVDRDGWGGGCPGRIPDRAAHRRAGHGRGGYRDRDVVRGSGGPHRRALRPGAASRKARPPRR
jgi:hypothetical protein